MCENKNIVLNELGEVEMKIEHSREWFNSHRKIFKYKLLEPCANCGKESKCLHHIVPLIKGGTNNESNIVQLCVECHGIIHDKDLVKMHKAAIEGKKRAKANNPNFKEGRPRKFNPTKVDEALNYVEAGNSYKKASEVFGISKTTLIRRMQERKSKLA